MNRHLVVGCVASFGLFPAAAAAAGAGPETTVRKCSSRGEPSGPPASAPPALRYFSLGPTRSGLDSHATEEPSSFASLAERPGFREYVNGPRGQAMTPAERERLERLARTHYMQLKAPIAVRSGHRVTLAIAPADRGRAAFLFTWGRARGRRIGPYGSAVRVADGTPRLRLVGCRPGEPLFSGRGTVGRWTWFPGSMVVAGAGCVGLEAHERGRPVRRAQLRFGVGRCPPPQAQQSKEGTNATLLNRVPLDARPGTRVRVAWRLTEGGVHTAGAPADNRYYVRLLSATGARSTHADGQARDRRFVAIVRVPRGGIGDIEIRLRGWQITPGGSRRADALIPITNDPLPERTGPTRVMPHPL